ncbi:MAG: phosphatase PAP2 family protein [Anaerolineaceae bacterium]|nr:phosphatase PAP2 family protein [Anaerolineaceae bacterium]
MSSSLPFSFRMEILALTLLGWLVIYFFVNRLPINSVRRLNLATSIDRGIPFMPQFAPIYFSSYIFVIQPFLILRNEKQFYIMLVSFVSITICATLIHALVPSKIERVEQLDSSNPSGWMLNLFQKTCKPHGNFPSMHVGLSIPVVVTNFLTGGILLGGISLAWAVLIAISTLYTKQHYILDVLAGLVGGLVISALVFGIFNMF